MTPNGTAEGYIVDLIKLLNQSNVFRRPFKIYPQENKTYGNMIRKLVDDVSQDAILFIKDLFVNDFQILNIKNIHLKFYKRHNID